MQLPPMHLLSTQSESPKHDNPGRSLQENQLMDDQLIEQFRYLRREFMEEATRSGVTVPMDMLDDSSGQIYQFMKYNGPKYIFQTMQNRFDDNILLRCALSVQIICVTILRRKVAMENSQRTAWAQDALVRIAEAGAIQVCINVMIKCFDPKVQELSITLIASIIAISEDYIQLMLFPPNAVLAESNTSSIALSSPTVFKDGELTGGSASARKKKGSSSGVSGRDTSSSAVAGTGTGTGVVHNLPFGTDAASRPTTGAEKKQEVDFSKFNFTFNKGSIPIKRPISRQRKTTNEAHTCMSYILSVSLLQKNRHLVLAACADIILAMLKPVHSGEQISEAIAKSPTCPLPSTQQSDGNKLSSLNSAGSARTSFRARISMSAAPVGSLDPDPGSSNAFGSASTQIIEWAGLKILLKFLFRYHKMCASRNKPNALAKDEVSPFVGEREEMLYAHKRVLTAVCKLIAGSPVVASYANTLPGAEQLISLSAGLHYPISSTHLLNAVNGCMDALYGDKQMHVRRQRSYNSQSFSEGAGGDRVARAFLHTGNNGSSSSNNNTARRSPSRRGSGNYYSQRHSARGDGGAGTILGGASTIASSTTTTNVPTGSLNPNVIAANVAMIRQRHLLVGSAPREETHSAKINLISSIDVPFKSEYNVETEQHALQLENAFERKKAAAKDARAAFSPSAKGEERRGKSKEKKKRDRKSGGLLYDPGSDTMLDTYLNSIDFATKKSILPEKRDGDGTFILPKADSDNAEAAAGMQRGSGKGLQQDSAGAETYASTRSSTAPIGSIRKLGSAGDAGRLARASSVDSIDSQGSSELMLSAGAGASSMNLQKDLFNRLPLKPALPRRIEPRDIIDKSEGLPQIRLRYSLIAHKAMRKLKTAGGNMVNGRDSISITERAEQRYIATPAERLRALGEVSSSPLSSPSSPSAGTGAAFGRAKAKSASALGGRQLSRSADFRNDGAESHSILPEREGNIGRSPGEDSVEERGATIEGGIHGERGTIALEEAMLQGMKLETASSLEAEQLFDGFRSIFDYPVKESLELEGELVSNEIGAEGSLAEIGEESGLQLHGGAAFGEIEKDGDCAASPSSPQRQLKQAVSGRGAKIGIDMTPTIDLMMN